MAFTSNLATYHLRVKNEHVIRKPFFNTSRFPPFIRKHQFRVRRACFLCVSKSGLHRPKGNKSRVEKKSKEVK